MTHFLYHLMWIKCVYLSPVTFSRSFEYDLQFENPTTAKTNICANIFQILRNKSTHLHFRLKLNFSNTCTTCDYENTWLLASMNHRLSSRVWYVSSAYLPYGALLPLDGINACLPFVALLLLLLQHTHNTLVSSSSHSNYCTWRAIRRLLLRNIARVPLSLHSYHSTKVSRWYYS
jgi:hypothetical protein